MPPSNPKQAIDRSSTSHSTTQAPVVEAINQYLVEKLAEQLSVVTDARTRQRLTKEMGRKQCSILQVLHDRPRQFQN